MEKGFTRTAIDCESVDPKAQVNSEKRDNATYFIGAQRLFLVSKGNQVNIPEPSIGQYNGDIREYGDGCHCSIRSYLFFLTD